MFYALVSVFFCHFVYVSVFTGQVIPSAWPTPVDDWTKEHVLADGVQGQPLNLTLNRTSSLERLAKRRPDVVVFADASLDMKTYFLAFGRVAPVQVSLRGSDRPRWSLPYNGFVRIF